MIEIFPKIINLIYEDSKIKAILLIHINNNTNNDISILDFMKNIKNDVSIDFKDLIIKSTSSTKLLIKFNCLDDILLTNTIISEKNNNICNWINKYIFTDDNLKIFYNSVLTYTNWKKLKCQKKTKNLK